MADVNPSQINQLADQSSYLMHPNIATHYHQFHVKNSLISKITTPVEYLTIIHFNGLFFLT